MSEQVAENFAPVRMLATTSARMLSARRLFVPLLMFVSLWLLPLSLSSHEIYARNFNL
jgi:hypothetical protein